jgi:chromosome segregation ATPase
MTHVEQVKGEIQKAELKLEGYRGKLAELKGREEQAEKAVRPLQKKIAEGDIGLLQKVAKLRAESTETKLHIEALQVEIPELESVIEALRTTRMAEAEELDRWDRQHVRYGELLKRAPVLQKNATEFRKGYDEFTAIVAEMERDNQQAADKLEFNGKAFRYWLEALLYPRINSFLARGQGHTALEPFRDLPETLEKYIGKFFTAKPRKAA